MRQVEFSLGKDTHGYGIQCIPVGEADSHVLNDNPCVKTMIKIISLSFSYCWYFYRTPRYCLVTICFP